MVDRRSFLRIVSGIAASALPAAPEAVPQSKSGVRVVIIGAGVAGVRAAVRLRQHAPGTDITLIDPASYRAVNPFAKINGMITDSAMLPAVSDIKRVVQRVAEVDPVGKRVTLRDGTTIVGDLLVFAPGVEFKNDDRLAHPLNDSKLQRQLAAMHDGDVVIVSIPRAPYQYPHGPYINISKIAEYLHAGKPRSKVLLFDHNSGSSIAELYRRQWRKQSSMAPIERIEVEAGYVHSVNYEAGVVHTTDGMIQGGVIALMDEQRAAAVTRKAGLSLQSDWCHVKQATLESLHYPDVFVLGDANDAAQHDKTAFAAVQQADAFVRAITARIV